MLLQRVPLGSGVAVWDQALSKSLITMQTDCVPYAREVDVLVDQQLLSAVRLIILDFDGVLTDNFVYVSEQGLESVRCNRSDGIGISRVCSLGVHVAIVSTETNGVVAMRARKLDIPCQHGVEDKAAAVLALQKTYAVSASETLFVGNDINDLGAFASVGVPVAVSDAYPEVFPHVLFRTQRPGGYGAVREVCDLVYRAIVNGQEKDKA